MVEVLVIQVRVERKQMKKLIMGGILLSLLASAGPSVKAQTPNNDNIIWGGNPAGINRAIQNRFVVQKTFSVIFPDNVIIATINNIIWGGHSDNIIWGG